MNADTAGQIRHGFVSYNAFFLFCTARFTCRDERWYVFTVVKYRNIQVYLASHLLLVFVPRDSQIDAPYCRC